MSSKKSSNTKAKSEVSPKKPLSSKWWPFLFFILSFLLYANTLQHQYAQDDDIYTRKNSFVQKGISAFSDIVGKGTLVGFDGTNISDYRPFTLLTFALEKSLFGNSPKSNHLINVLLYALACSLLFLLLTQLFQEYSLLLSISITLLFIMHPLHTEVVANIKSRDEILCFLMGLLTIRFAFSYAIHNEFKQLIWGLFCFFLCLSSKESGFTFLGLMPLCLFFYSSSSYTKIAKITAYFALIAILHLIIRYMILDNLMLTQNIVVMDNSLLAANSIADQIATNFTMLLKAVQLLFVPLTLSYDYSFNQFPIVGFSDFWAVISMLLYTILLVIAIRGFSKKNIFSFCVLFYIVSYALTCNLFFKIGSSFAERFLFVPSLSFCIAMPFLLAQVFKIDFKENAFQNMTKYIALLSFVLILFGFKTVSRSKDWKNSVTLFESGVSTSPNSARVHFAYANDFREKTEAATDMYQKIEFGKKAIEAFQKGLAIYNRDERIYYNMGVVYYNMNDTANAFLCYQKAIQINGKYAEALNNLGVIYFNKKDFAKARQLFEKSVKNSKNYADAYANLGACLHNIGEVKLAIPSYLRAIEINPNNISVKRNLSMAYLSIGDSASAAFYRNQAY